MKHKIHFIRVIMILLMINITPVWSQDCPNNLVQNSSFIEGAIPGAMPSPGQVSNWSSSYGSPDVRTYLGCGDSSFIAMWGNKVVGEAIHQTLSILLEQGQTYAISFCAHWDSIPGRPIPLQFEFRASNTPLTGPQDPNGVTIGVSTAITTHQGWVTMTMPAWTNTIEDYSILTISATNESSENAAEATSYGGIDRICIYEEYCPGNILQNGNFVEGAVPGPMPTGQTSHWTRAANWTVAVGGAASPDVSISMGCGDTVIVGMWGNKVVGEAIEQTLEIPLQSCSTYAISFCAYWPTDVNRYIPLQFAFYASNATLNGPTDPNAFLIGVSPPITTNDNWVSVSLPVDCSTHSLDPSFSILTVCATNASSVIAGDSTSYGYIDRICIHAGVECVDIPICQGWNLVSVPLVQCSTYAAIDLFPSAFGDLYDFEQGIGYIPVATLEMGTGYWAYYPSATTVTICGACAGQMTINAKLGWNLIGSTCVPIDVSSITVSDGDAINGGNAFLFHCVSYIPSSIIYPGDGAWVYVIGPSPTCILTFPCVKCCP